MNTQQAYDSWSDQYDTNLNKTRDLEGVALRDMLAGINIDHCLEIGCGTGKNTAWLITQAKSVTAVDLSQSMLSKAKEKIKAANVDFIQADILQEWTFADKKYNLVGFSLVLEHIENLEPVFEKVAKLMADDGLVYVGELHPFKQYTGTKARFNTDEGEQVVPCFNHHVSDFIQAAKKAGFSIVDLREYFDEGQDPGMPRILAMLLKKFRRP